MQVNFFDDAVREDLFPLTFTRPTALLRCGITNIAEKWKLHLNLTKYGFKTVPYLTNQFPAVQAPLFINGRLLPDPKLCKAISSLTEGEYLTVGDAVLAYHTTQQQSKKYTETYGIINRAHQLFSFCGEEIMKDFELITNKRKSETISESNTIIGKFPIFLEKGAKVEATVLNATNGPIYLDKNSEIMEGSMIRGPFTLGEGSTIKMGAKIYENTAIGPFCKIGGEVNNSVVFGYSNKGHDGFLGNSVLGEWCNLGADTNNSNLKNNYDEVKLWNYRQHSFEKTGLQFCGLIMGDHSKTGINTMLNTGTVIGVSCNIFGSGFPRNFVPSFAWGGASGFSTYQINKALETAKIVYQRRNKQLSLDDENTLEQIFNLESTNRYWETKK